MGGAMDFRLLIRVLSPVAAILNLNGRPHCTATLISRLWVITTCKCVNRISPKQLTVRIGDPTMTGTVKHKIYRVVGAFCHHSCFRRGQYRVENDVSLVQIHEPFFDSRYVYVVRIPRQLTYWTPDSTLNMEISVYSDLQDKARSMVNAIWHAVSQLLHPGICLKHLRVKNFVLGKTMCASYFHKAHDYNCKLDFGAPLVYDYVLIGILVYKEGCGNTQGVGVFVNIPMHSVWIRHTIHTHTPWIHV